MNLEITNKENPTTDFRRIAEHLMNECVLSVGSNNYRFTSLEFYYFDEELHPDVYSHKHPNQKTSGQWYFHGSGLDITFGSDKVFGGILIRGIRNLEKMEFINGPIKCVQELFSNLGSVNSVEKISFCIQELLFDKALPSIKEEEIYSGRRFGLNEKIDIQGKFYNGQYRFFINPKETQKDKSFVAIDFLRQGYSKTQINELFGYKHFKQE
jgi:hypothetical protein